MRQKFLILFYFFLLPGLACDSAMQEKSKKDSGGHQTSMTKGKSEILNLVKNFDSGVFYADKEVIKTRFKDMDSHKEIDVYEIPKQRPARERSCREKATFGEHVYQQALNVAQQRPCEQNSDCMLVRNSTHCVLKSSCERESYEGVYKTHAVRLINLRAKLYEEVCQGCENGIENCRKPPMTAQCVHGSCQVVQAHGSFGLKVQLGRLEPRNSEIKKAFARRADRFERCAKRYALQDGFDQGVFEYAFTLNDTGHVTRFEVLKGQNYQKLNECLVKIIKPYQYPRPLGGQNHFKQTLHFLGNP